MRVCFAVFLLCSLLVLPAMSQIQADTLILTNVNVVDTRNGDVGHNLTVVIKNQRIHVIAKFGFIQESRKTHVINANGKYLIPGLWDMHVHSAGGPVAPWDEAVIYPLYIANGVTGIRDMGGNPDLLESRRNRIDKGELLGPRILYAGPFLDGGKPESDKKDPQMILVNTPAEARAAVDSLQKRGVDFIKVLSDLNRDTYFAIASESAKVHLRFVGHVPESISAAEASTVGQRSIEHLSGISLACSSKEEELRRQRLDAMAKNDNAEWSAANKEVLATYDPEKAKALFRELATNNTYQVPTLVWWQANAKFGDPDLGSDPRLKYVPAWVRADWSPDKLKTPQPQLDYLKSLVVRDLQITRSMQRLAVPFMAGTDGPDPYVFPGFSLHDELSMLVDAGFTSIQALQSATYVPALFLNKLDKFGVVEPGRAADLVLLDANPLENIHNTSKISAVLVGGKYYSRADLDRMLATLAEKAAAQTTVPK
jgi:hypothetical protein